MSKAELCPQCGSAAPWRCGCTPEELDRIVDDVALEAALRAILPYAEARAVGMRERAVHAELCERRDAREKRAAANKATAAVDAAKRLLGQAK